MAVLWKKDPTGRFGGLADAYAKHRPGYPDAAVDFLVSRCNLGRKSVLVDVGCGTGISSRQVTARGVRVIGVEPNEEMRARAAAEPMPPDSAPVEYRDGRAEATGLAGGGADAVLAAQAFHWFEPAQALNEFRRILKPNGWVALLWNERDETDPFTAAYGTVLRQAPETKAVEVPRGQAGNALFESPLFGEGERVVFPNSQQLDEEGLLGRAFSASYAPRGAEPAARFAEELRHVFGQFQQNGLVVLRYESALYLARRRDDPAAT
jgi:SAM-dependent methyltransferase